MKLSPGNKNKEIKSSSDDMGSTIMSFPPPESLSRLKPSNLPGLSPVFAEYGEEGRCFKIRLANRQGTRRQAGLLVNRRYVERGYGEQEIGEKPQRLTIVAYDGDVPVGTLSMGLDGPAGLLCDELYGLEIDLLRVRGRKVLELVKLAADASSARIQTMAALFHVAFINAYHIHGYDDAVMEINPRHVNFYRNRLGFKLLGPNRLNKRVNAPAVLMHCSLTEMENYIKTSGGCAELRGDRSLYPYFFSPQDAEGIRQRLSLHAGKSVR